MPPPAHRSALVCACVILAACGGGGGGAQSPPPPQVFSVGGTVSGLESVGLVLQNNGGPDLAISANGAFSFPAQLTSGTAYSVTIKTQPSIGPVQACSVTNGTGMVANTAVTNVAVACVSRVYKFLYTSSATTNEIRGYSIDATAGTLTALPWPPVVTALTPLGRAADPAGRFLYQIMIGQLDPVRVAVYAVDHVSGALTEIVESPYDLTPPLSMPASIGVQTALHRSGAFVYFAVRTPSTVLYGATIHPMTGALTPIPGMPIQLGDAANVLFDSTGRFLFVSTNRSFQEGEIRSFLVNEPSGVPTLIGPTPTPGWDPAGALLTPGDDYLLTLNRRPTGSVMVFAVDKSVGTLTPVTGPIATGLAGPPLAMVYNRRNNVFYIWDAEFSAASIAAFRLDPATGGVAPVGPPVSSNGGTGPLLLHPSGRFLFQQNVVTATIQRFAIDAATGALGPPFDVAALPVGTPVSTLIDASGKFLYLTNPSTGTPSAATLSSYSIDATTGSLTLINTVSSPAVNSTTPFLLQ